MIQAKFGLNWPSGFRGEDCLKSLQTDDGRQVMAIAHSGGLKMKRSLPDPLISRSSFVLNCPSLTISRCRSRYEADLSASGILYFKLNVMDVNNKITKPRII
jgi:hypothetical protein